MTTNISKEKREKLVAKINEIKKYIQSSPQDENTANLLTYIADIEKDIKGKKYGLVFEEHKEAIDEILENNVPVLKEDESLFIDNGGQMNFLIEGDNLASLQLLEKTHKGKIDLIYIDPPYNMGKKGNDDFMYNDSYVNNEDLYRHSKWLSFMNLRLRIAKNLLSDKGIIFISIDENELANLTLLSNEIFGAENYISSSFVLDNLKGKANDNFITSVGSRLLIYAKKKEICNEIGFNESENIFGQKVEDAYKSEDDLGFYNLITFKKTGQSKYREDRPFMFYPILEKNNTLFPITIDEFEKIYNKKTRTFNDNYLQELKIKYSDFNFILPTDSNGNYLRWTSGYNTFIKKMNNDIIYSDGVKQKNRPEANEMLQYYVSGTPKSFMYKPLYANGTEDLKRILPNCDFSFPKPIELMKDIIKLYKGKNYTILDFFGGSGTTGHAVMKLNAEDGGNRKFILCTNNENNICRDVTYERIKRVIEKEGYKASLKYMKVDFVPITEKFYYEYADELLKNVKELVELENGINFNGNKEIAIILTEEELDKFMETLPEECKSIYLAHNILPTDKQEKLFKEKEIKVNIIPDYYYRELED